MEKDQYIGHSPIKGNPKKPLKFVIEDKAITPRMLSDRIVPDVIQPVVDVLDAKCRAAIADLQNQIDSIDKYGIAVSNEFGNDPHISISQKTMTEAINDIWEKIEDMTGETIHGISLEMNPNYFISETGATIHITANTVDVNGVFEKIQFFGNGTLIAEAENVESFEFDTTITETTVIMCKAKIMGVEYTRQEIVTHYNSYWLGCGATYQDVMINSNLKPITEGMRANYDVTCGQGEYLFIILGESLRPGFIRADMNSFEIPFEETAVTINGNVYAVLKSQNAYQAGTYNIDING